MGTITREVLEERRQQLQAAVARLEANLHANRGALGMVDALIAQIDASEPEPVEG